MTYCVALIGSMASGKTTAAHYFKSQGIDVINADEIARNLVKPNEPALAEIEAYFGRDILTEEGWLNRKKLRHHILQNASDRAWLESRMHPRIRKKIEEEIRSCHSAYVIIEIPLLKERQSYPYLSRILLIEAPLSEKISRIMHRDNCSEQEALAFLNIQQAIQSHQHKLADDIIENNSTLEKLLEKLKQLHQNYLNAAKNASISSFVKDEK